MTPESADRTWQALRPLLADIDRAAAQLTAEEAAAVVRFLGAAADAMRRYAGPPAGRPQGQAASQAAAGEVETDP